MSPRITVRESVAVELDLITHEVDRRAPPTWMTNNSWLRLRVDHDAASTDCQKRSRTDMTKPKPTETSRSDDLNQGEFRLDHPYDVSIWSQS